MAWAFLTDLGEHPPVDMLGIVGIGVMQSWAQTY
jgi:hypothetical protein